MFKRKNVLSILLVCILFLSSTIVFAEELLPEVQNDLIGPGLSIPDRNASHWALNELVDSDRYGLYKSDNLYKNNLRNLLDDDLKESLLKNFAERLEKSGLEKVEKPNFLIEVKNSKTRGGFLRELYNILVPYEDETNLGKDPIMYLNHAKIVLGSGRELFLDRNITSEEAIIFTKRAIDYIYKENDLESKGLMWKVENKGNTVYLLGSIHYGNSDLYPFRNEVLNNFTDSEKLYVEADITNKEELMKVMMEKMSELEEEIKKTYEYQDGTTLSSVIDETLYSKIKVIMNKYNIPKEEYEKSRIQGVEQKLNEIMIDKVLEDLPDENQEEFKKAMEESEENELMNLLIEGPKYGVDFYFLDKAKTLNKKVGELESLESQMELLFKGGFFGDPKNSMSEEEQIERLKELLKNFDDEGNIIKIEEPQIEQEESDKDFDAEVEKVFEEQLNELEEMFDSIKKGDAEKIAKLFMESGSAEILGGQLLGERDKDMAKKIADLLEGEEEKTYFIVVGAAHFTVEGTILDNLKKMGYKVERINE